MQRGVIVATRLDLRCRMQAATMGITSLERHITIDRAMYGSDQAASVEPTGFRYLVGAVRKIEKRPWVMEYLV